jgi:hypothetical protein
MFHNQLLRTEKTTDGFYGMKLSTPTGENQFLAAVEDDLA